MYGRGGQGVVTAANILARAACLAGLWSQTYPFFGAERRGAPVSASVRISKDRIRSKYIYIQPDVAIVLDHKLYNPVNIYQSVKEGGVVIINTPFKVVKSYKHKVFYINANEIARKLGLFFAGWSLVNMPMLGAFSKVTGLVGLEHVIQSVREYIHGELAELNVEAVKLAYNEVYEDE
ncbi:MAG: 2-oxoacid:acceptor oxidoreductase family protein [Sulfolobales archaeon]|nr:2-oxoacid:acceptor oxidoreductase family protein [Sulfolobales archaeon]